MVLRRNETPSVPDHEIFGRNPQRFAHAGAIRSLAERREVDSTVQNPLAAVRNPCLAEQSLTGHGTRAHQVRGVSLNPLFGHPQIRAPRPAA